MKTMINYSHNPHECASVRSSTYPFSDNNSQLLNNQANLKIQIDTCLFKYGIDLIRQPLSYGSASVNSKSVPLLSKSSILLSASSDLSSSIAVLSNTTRAAYISTSDLTSKENLRHTFNVEENKLTVSVDNSLTRSNKTNSMKLSNSADLICLSNNVKARSLSNSDELTKSDDEINNKVSSVREHKKDNREEEIKTTQASNTCKYNWDIICKLINCKVAFKKQYNGKKYNWIQLAGHPGRFKPGEREGFILKLMDKIEHSCLENLQKDILNPFVPHIDQVFFDNNEDQHYLEMQDLLYGFKNPSIMDIKIGVRTFIIDESNDKETKPRNDLYLKLMSISPDEPTEYEHQTQAITKRRYMIWRETSSCSATLGFRIEAIKINQVSEKEFFSLKEKREVVSHFKRYTNNNKNIIKMYIDRLVDLKNTLLQSTFFNSHEMIGSSLLFVHDETKASIWMIDFGKTRPLAPGVRLTHKDKWTEGSHEDGYLIGIDNLIDIFTEIYLSI